MLKRVLVLLVLVLGLWGCGDRLNASSPQALTSPVAQPVVTQQLVEVATPSLINELRKDLDQYQPQVKILSPQPHETLDSTTIQVKLQVNDLPLFKDAELGMGPHVHLFVDDQPYVAIYDVSQPITLENLTPGSHTLRAFASRPWHESFKNEGAYAETVFNIFTASTANLPDPKLPLLTYSRPQGTYGAEPIMLDFYLTNAPLHFVAQQDTTDSVADWRVRVTVNGESFVLDNWQPIYLQGFKKGENWLKLEFIDEQGNLVDNVYNNPVRVINYDPKVNDTLAKLVQNKLPLRTAKRLVTTRALPPEPEVVEELAEPATTGETAPELEKQPETPVDEVTEPESEVETPAIAPAVETAPVITEPETIEVPVPEVLESPEPMTEEPVADPEPMTEAQELPDTTTDEAGESQPEAIAAPAATTDESDNTVTETDEQALENASDLENAN